MAEEKKEKAPKGEGKKGLPFVAKILIIAIVLILIVVISVGSAFFIASKMNKSSAEGTNTVETHETTKAEGEKSAEATGYGKIMELGEYTINLKEVEPRYLVIKLNLELNPEIEEKELTTLETEIEEKKIILQDVMLAILREKSLADLEADKDYEALKKELTEAVNKVLGEGIVKTIRFNNLLIQ